MSDSPDPQADALSNQDLEGISGAVASGILRAAREQDPDQHRRRRLIGAGYIVASLVLLGLVIWGWRHTPNQTVVLNATFLADARLTAVLSRTHDSSSEPASFLLRLDGVEEISRLQNSLLPTKLILPLDESKIREPLREIEKLEFGMSDEEIAGGQNGAAVSVSVSASEVREITLSRPSQGGQGITIIDVKTVADLRNQARLSIEVLQESDRTVRISAVGGSETLAMGNKEASLDLPLMQLPKSILGEQLVGSSFETNTGSEFPGMRFDARVSRLILSGTEGFFDVGQKRVPLVSDDTLELILLEENSFGVEMVDGKISLGSAAVATSVKRGESQLLGRQIQVSPVYRTIVTGYGAALLGLLSSVLPALLSIITLLFRYLFRNLPFGRP